MNGAPANDTVVQVPLVTGGGHAETQPSPPLQAGGASSSGGGVGIAELGVVSELLTF